MRALAVVDVAPFVADPRGAGRAHVAAAAALRAAFETDGFAFLKGHGVHPRVMSDVLTVSRAFFDLPPARKAVLKMRGFRGYQDVGQNVTLGRRDAHEAMDFFSESSQATGVLREYQNQWPSDDEVPGYRAALSVYVDRLLHAGRAVMAAIARGLDLPSDHFDASMIDPYWVLRSISYPPQADIAGKGLGVGCGEHTDYGYLTFLHTDGTKDTLQVKSLCGDWITVNDVPEGAFIINIGDMLSHVTGGVYRATPHRVLSAPTQRLSVPFFYEPSFASSIPSPGGESVTYGEHLYRKLNSNFA
eukprot:Hpha_TRINITY_DN4162_c0_g1::TRINITY_DN4162_c0_g1_i1::g.194858::m.194858